VKSRDRFQFVARNAVTLLITDSLEEHDVNHSDDYCRRLLSVILDLNSSIEQQLSRMHRVFLSYIAVNAVFARER